MANRMILNETAWFGRGAVGALTDEVKRRGYQKALIVTDKTLVQCGVVAKVTDKMDAAGLAWAIYDGVMQASRRATLPALAVDPLCNLVNADDASRYCGFHHQKRRPRGLAGCA